MKNFSFLLLTLLLSGSLFSQTTLNTNAAGNWTMTGIMACNPAPLSPAAIAALNFPSSPVLVCTGINSATGNSNLGPGTTSCLIPDFETRVFRNSHNFNTQPCLVTYNFSADNAFRIYVNGNSSPTNSLPGTPPTPPANGVCGNGYTGNDWNAAFTGTLNIPDFMVGNNTLDFETTNGTSPVGPHPYWLSGDLLFWQFSDLNASFLNNFTHNPTTGTVSLNYQTTSQTNGALYNIRVERSFSYPNNPVWSPFFSRTNTNLKDFKMNPCPPVPGMFCDASGSAVRITFTAMAGTCQVSTTYLWHCRQGFGAEPVVQTTSSTDNPDFVLTSEQIKDLHEQFNEKVAADRNTQVSVDSVFATLASNSELLVFPNPSNGHIWVKATASEVDLTPIKIFNQIGELVFEGQIQGRQELDLSRLPNGVYFLKTFGEKASDLRSTQFVLLR